MRVESSAMWEEQRPKEYDRLKWVQADSLTHPFIELSQVSGTHVDVGTGTGVILNTLASEHERSIGIDASREMLDQIPRLGAAHHLLRGSATEGLPLRDGVADLVTERMMLHDLANPGEALQEMWRLVRPGGQMIVAEYVTDVPGQAAIDTLKRFEHRNGTPVSSLTNLEDYAVASTRITGLLRALFTLKHEPDRFLWQAEEFKGLATENCPNTASVELKMGVTRHSVANWLEKSGFPIDECKQQGLMRCLAASTELKQEMGIAASVAGESIDESRHAELLREYQSASPDVRETLLLDVHFPAAFAYVSLIKGE